MRKDGAGKNKDYLSVTRELRAIISQPRYKDGGWLPSIRKMAKELGASYMTYSKALDKLADEGLAKSFPCKGHYVNPEYLRPKKIGIILGGGGDSPFVNPHAGIPSAIEYLTGNSFYTQIIQGVSLENLQENLTTHAILGLLWFLPPPKAAKTAKSIFEAGEMPIVIVNGENRSNANIAPNVSADWRQYDIERAETLLSRGHRRIIRIYGENRQIRDFSDDLAKHGAAARPEDFIPMLNREPGQVLAALKKSGATAIMAEGGAAETNNLFCELAQLPSASQPEVLHYPYPVFASLAKRFPQIKLLSLDYKKLPQGEAASQMLLKHITDGEPLRSALAKLETTGVTEHWRE